MASGGAAAIRSENLSTIAGQVIPFRARRLSSSLNAMAYVRGHPADFDRLAELGLHGWSFREVLPYFRRQERWY